MPKYKFGYAWYGLYVGDTLITDVEPKQMMMTEARELNAKARGIGVKRFGWSLLSDEDKELLADEWMVANFGEDGLHDPITR